MLFCFFESARKEKVNDFRAVGNRGINLAHGNNAFGGYAAFLLKLADAGRKGVLALFKLSCRKLKQHTVIWIAKLTDKQKSAVFRQRGNADSAVVFNKLAVGCFAVRKNNSIVIDVDYSAFKHSFSVYPFFGKIHFDVSFRNITDRLLNINLQLMKLLSVHNWFWMWFYA